MASNGKNAAITLTSSYQCKQLLDSLGGDVSQVVARLLIPKSVRTTEVGTAKQNFATLLFYLLDPTNDSPLAEKFDAFYKLGQDTVCGYVFKEGELVFHCVDCAVDNTCVFCQHCFNASDHEGHSVKYHRSGGGGVCDCGDTEAWNPRGFCKHHSGGLADEHGATTSDPFDGVPDSVVDALRIFFPAVLEEIVAYADQLHASFVRPAMGTMTFEPEDRVVISLHNDDWHTYEQVIAMVREIKQCKCEV